MKNKVSEKMTGVPKSDNQKKKLKEYNNLSKTCPHCGIVGKGPSMQRWHFKNCKHVNN